MKYPAILLPGAFALAALTAAASPPAARDASKPAKQIDYTRDVRPILSSNCFRCHGPDDKARKARLRLDTKAGATKSAIVPGDPKKSELIDRITSDDDSTVMPPPK